MRLMILFFACIAQSFALTDFQLHNTQKAHEGGITGKNIAIGIVDDAFNTNHINLQNKDLGIIYPNDFTNPNFQQATHGSHVAGIALGAKLDTTKPYGVAYDAKFFGVGGVNYSQNIPNLYDFYSNKNIKVINNSWGVNIYPLQGLESHQGELKKSTTYTPEYSLLYLTKGDPTSSQLYQLAKEKQILSVFAAGNEGMLSPSLQASLPSLDESVQSWLAVGALDSSNIQREGDKLIVSPRGVVDFSNGFKDAINYGITAAGYGVNNVDSSKKDGYSKKSGTSMAAPVVSGAAALVAEKYPFLNGKQIADVLLSTANRDYKAPKMIVRSVSQGKPNNFKYLLVYLDTSVPTTDEEKKADLKEYYKDLKDADKSVQEVLDNLDTIQDNDGTQDGAIMVKKEEIFGRGILDIEKALQGLSELDANRLNDSDVQTYQSEQETAYYSLDTQGNDAEFSNSIQQRKWDASTHRNDAANKPQKLDGLNVGFIKIGDGILTLSGENSYKGATIIKKGGIRLIKRNDSGGKLSSNVYVEQSGTLKGNGEITGDLHNEGIVHAGDNDLKDLRVIGKYTQKQNGTLELEFGDFKNSKLIANAYLIEGGKLTYVPLVAYYTPGKEVKIDLGDLGNYLGSFSEVVIANTQSLVFILDGDNLTINKQIKPDSNQSIIVTPQLKPNAYEVPNSTMGNTLRTIRTTSHLSPQYEAFFSELDTSSAQNAKEILNSIEQNAYLKSTENIISQQTHALQNNTLMALNPVHTTASNALHIASLESDAYYTFMQDIENQDKFFYIAPGFKKHLGKDYDGQAYGLNISFGETANSKDALSLHLQLQDSTMQFSQADIKTKNVSLGLNYLYNMTPFNLISGITLSRGNNTINRQIINAQEISANYNNYLASAQLGISKDFFNTSFTLTPIAYLSYHYTYQDSFSENGGLFAKSYDAITHNSTTITAGLTLDYTHQNTSKLSGFLLYDYRLSGKEILNSVSFNDFVNLPFLQKHHLDSYSITLGATGEINLKSIFVRLSLINEFTKNQYNLSTIGTLGWRF
ncbi:S8 family serine peptidase [Helicobacter sp.]|uniref:S8 family serine peptidase n=1 Tax=Helicobacter sp. TaxID=218 RepID=UPI002A75C4E1|nr:S8 family serine peptidase [Helicobacter sp.]MDY2585683.1 S8 family serine peptidase [Helicobacter sp.]